MAEHTKIEWTDATWNIVTGCTLVDVGCRHCYAARLAATRLKNIPSRQGLARLNAAGEAKFTGEVRFNEQWLTQPLGWKRPRRVFVCAHGDLFHEAVPDEWIDKVFAVMGEADQHVFQVLTKRPERMCEFLAQRRAEAPRQVPVGLGLLGYIPWNREVLPPRNIWLGTSISDQASAEARVPHLLATPAAVRFLSAEPLLGPVPNVQKWLGRYPVHMQPGGPSGNPSDGWIEYRDGINWIIVGGESGPNARPMHPDWARSLRDQCQAAGVAFFMKQMGGRRKPFEPIPDDLMVREFPDA